MSKIIVPKRQIKVPRRKIKVGAPYFNRLKDVYLPMPRTTQGLAGRFKFRKFKMDANDNEITTYESDWIPNLIVTQGKDYFATININGLIAAAHVGSGNSTPSAADTSLETFIAGTTNIQDTIAGVQSSPPYYGRLVRTFRFSQGAAEGTIAEVGIATNAANGNIFSRALVLTSGGSPTTISVSATEWLDVTYEFRNYPYGVLANGDPDDQTGQFDINTDTYDYTFRACQLTVTSPRYLEHIELIGLALDSRFTFPTSWLGGLYSSDATLGSVLGTPSATESGAISATNGSGTVNDAYSAGSFTRTGTLTIALDDGNFAGGVKALWWLSGFQAYQMHLERASDQAAVPKDNTKVWTFEGSVTWTNATIT